MHSVAANTPDTENAVDLDQDPVLRQASIGVRLQGGRCRRLPLAPRRLLCVLLQAKVTPARRLLAHADRAVSDQHIDLVQVEALPLATVALWSLAARVATRATVALAWLGQAHRTGVKCARSELRAAKRIFLKMLTFARKTCSNTWPKEVLARGPTPG